MVIGVFLNSDLFPVLRLIGFNFKSVLFCIRLTRGVLSGLSTEMGAKLTLRLRRDLIVDLFYFLIAF